MHIRALHFRIGEFSSRSDMLLCRRHHLRRLDGKHQSLGGCFHAPKFGCELRIEARRAASLAVWGKEFGGRSQGLGETMSHL